jgi:hypothetical protein
MATDFRPLEFHFNATTGVEQSDNKTAVFGSAVRRADVSLKSFDIGYTNEDHHIQREKVVLKVTGIQQNAVDVHIDFLFRDSSGKIDDQYDGTIQAVVIADVA